MFTNLDTALVKRERGTITAVLAVVHEANSVVLIACL